MYSASYSHTWERKGIPSLFMKRNLNLLLMYTVNGCTLKKEAVEAAEILCPE